MSISCQFRCSSFPKDFGETRGRQARASISSFRRSTTQHKKRRKPSRRAWVGNWEVRYRSQQGFTGMKYVFREIVCASIVTQGENHRLRIDLAKHFHFAIDPLCDCVRVVATPRSWLAIFLPSPGVSLFFIALHFRAKQVFLGTTRVSAGPRVLPPASNAFFWFTSFFDKVSIARETKEDSSKLSQVSSVLRLGNVVLSTNRVFRVSDFPASGKVCVAMGLSIATVYMTFSEPQNQLLQLSVGGRFHRVFHALLSGDVDSWTWLHLKRLRFVDVYGSFVACFVPPRLEFWFRTAVYFPKYFSFDTVEPRLTELTIWPKLKQLFKRLILNNSSNLNPSPTMLGQ